MFYKIFKQLSTKHKLPILGRWNYPKNDIILDRKIYLANYDNCGPCGYLYVKKNESTMNSLKKK